MARQEETHGARVPNVEGKRSRPNARNDKRWREREGARDEGGPGGFSNRGGDYGEWRDRNQRKNWEDRGFHRSDSGAGTGPIRVEGGPRQEFGAWRHDSRGELRNDRGFGRGSPGAPGSRYDDRRNRHRNDSRTDRRTDRRNDRRNDRPNDRPNDRWHDRRDNRNDKYDRRNDGRGKGWREHHNAGNIIQRRDGDCRGDWDLYDNRSRRDSASGDHGVEKPPSPPLPPSPIILSQLAELAKSQELTYDEEKGISNVALLNSRLNVMDLRLMEKDIGSWFETEEACQRMAIKLGIFTSTDNHRQPFSRDFLRRYDEGNVKKEGGVEHKENGAAPLDTASLGKVGVIPYERGSCDCSEVRDPRSEFADEYTLLQAWVAKPLPLPAFADPNALSGDKVVDDSPTHSWSRSPAKIRSETPLKRPIAENGVKGTRAAKHALNADRTTLARTSSCHSQHSLLSADSMLGESQEMELEEGYFRVKLLNGEPALLQYGEIVDLIRKGELPDGWSAYRDSDNLWVSVYVSQATDGAIDKGVDADQVANGGDPHNDANGTHKRRSVGAIADGRKNIPPGPLREEFVRAAREAKDAFGARVAKGSLIKFSRKASSSCSSRLPSDFALAAREAEEDLAAYDRILALRTNAKLLCGTPKPIEGPDRAMIRELVIEDRARLRDVASGALQKALRIFIQRKTSI